MPIVCCEYKVARRALVVTNIVVILFSFLYVGVVGALFWRFLSVLSFLQYSLFLPSLC